MKFFKRLTAVVLSVIMLLCFASCKGETETKVQNTLNANGSTLTAHTFLDEYKADPDVNANKITGFGFTADEFNEKFVKNGSWNAYTFKVSFGNSNDFGITAFGIDIKENGMKNVFVSTAGDAVMGLPANFTSTQDMYCKVIADSALSETDVIKTLGKMGIEIMYVNASTGAEDLSEVEQGELLYCPVDFIM